MSSELSVSNIDLLNNYVSNVLRDEGAKIWICRLVTHLFSKKIESCEISQQKTLLKVDLVLTSSLDKSFNDENLTIPREICFIIHASGTMEFNDPNRCPFQNLSRCLVYKEYLTWNNIHYRSGYVQIQSTRQMGVVVAGVEDLPTTINCDPNAFIELIQDQK